MTFKSIARDAAETDEDKYSVVLENKPLGCSGITISLGIELNNTLTLTT